MHGLIGFVLTGFMSTVVSAAVLSACGGQSDSDHRPREGENGAGVNGDGEGGGEGGAGSGTPSEAGAGTGGTIQAPGTNGRGGGSSPGSGGAIASGGYWTGGAPMSRGGATGSGGSVAAAGTGAGGTTTTPMGGRGPSELTCEPVREFSTDSYCSATLACEDTSYSLHCDHLGLDYWRCLCGSKQIDMFNSSSPEACLSAGRACAYDVPLRAATCDLLESTSDATSCSMREACGPEFDLGGGVMGRRAHDNEVTCELDRESDRGDLLCDCAIAGHSKQRRVRAASTADACSAVLDSCKILDPEVFTGPHSCTEGSITVTPESCQHDEWCSQSHAIAEGVEALSGDVRSTICLKPVNGVSECTCSTKSGSFDFEANLTAADRVTCVAASRYCDPTAEATTEGATTCEVLTEHTTRTSCETFYDCRKPFTIESTEFAGRGALTVACGQGSSGAWSCRCESQQSSLFGGHSVTFELEAPPMPAQACAGAVSRCQEELPDIVARPTEPPSPGSEEL